MKKMWVIRLVMFTPRVKLIKISKMAHFMYSFLDTANISPSLGKIHLNASVRLYLALSENAIDYVLRRYH